MSTPDAGPGQQLTEARYHHSEGFPAFLAEAGCSLLVSTYQAGQVFAISVHEGQVQITSHRVNQAMGIALGSRDLALGAKGQIWFLEDAPSIAAQVEPAGAFDHYFLARRSVVTDSIQCHEMAWGTGPDGQPHLWIVNTLFSCLAGLASHHSFVPRWRPPFITTVAAEDRCHLNGLAMREGRPAYVTMFSTTDVPAGWRELEGATGLVMEVASGEIVTTGLAMPHSPRWYGAQLLVLNSGLGRLERVDLSTGARDVVSMFPGYARGLAFAGKYAFVGLSRIRETAVFGKVPLVEFHDQLKCGIAVVDLTTGATVATFEFQSGVEEIFDVQVVPGARCAGVGPAPGDDGGVWLVPAVA